MVYCTPIATTYCGLCEEPIYRDTLDKDPAFRVYEYGLNETGILHSLVVCSEICRDTLLVDDEIWNKRVKIYALAAKTHKYYW